MRRTAVAVLVLSLAVTLLAKDDARPFPRDEKGNVVFQGVVQVEGATATELHSRAKFWAAKVFRSAQNVIQLDDPASGKLICKGGTHVSGNLLTLWVTFTLTIEAKDGRYRWTIDQIVEEPDKSFGGPIEKRLTKEGLGNTGRKSIYEVLRLDLEEMAADLAADMKVPSSKGADF